MRPPKYTPPSGTPTTTSCKCSSSIALGVFAAIIALAISVTVGISVLVTSTSDAYQRYAIEALASRAGSNGTGIMIGSVVVQSSDRTIAWNLDYTTDVNAILALYIMGPIPVGQTDAPLALSLCGSPSSLACDLTVAGHLEGLITQLDPGGTPLKPYINAIRATPWRYYLQVNTGTNPSGNGELRAPLGILGGTP
jgi:hypothetical protein